MAATITSNKGSIITTSTTPPATNTQSSITDQSNATYTTATETATTKPYSMQQIKAGYMKKMKTMRKKYFILNRGSDQIVWLDYYDSQKKYEQSFNSRSSKEQQQPLVQPGPQPSKKRINITNAFSINQRGAAIAASDKNHKQQFAIDIFTSNDVFSLVCESEADLNDWLDELRRQRSESLALTTTTKSKSRSSKTTRSNYQSKIVVKKKDNNSINKQSEPQQQQQQQQTNGSSGDSSGSTGNYAHVWQVTVAKKGLGLPPTNVSGIYRVCLTAKSLHVYKVQAANMPMANNDSKITSKTAAAAATTTTNSDDAANDVTATAGPAFEIQLNSIRKCARADHYFSLELGRQSGLGAGELCLATDDVSTARHMHEIIREAMKVSAATMNISNNNTTGSSTGTSSSTSSSGQQQQQHHLHRPRSASTSDGSCSRSRRSNLHHMHSANNSFSGGNKSQTPLVARMVSATSATGTTAQTNAAGGSATTSTSSIYSPTDNLQHNNLSSHLNSSSSSFRDRCDSEPGTTGHKMMSTSGSVSCRSRCVSEDTNAGGSQQLHYTTVSVSRNHNSSSPSHHPHHHHFQSGTLSSGGCSTESIGAASSVASNCPSTVNTESDYPEMDLHLQHIQQTGMTGPLPPPIYSHREVSSAVPSQPSILEADGEDSAEAYITMESKSQNPLDLPSSISYSSRDRRNSNDRRRNSMTMNFVSNNSPYVDMSNPPSHHHVTDAGTVTSNIASLIDDTYVDMSCSTSSQHQGSEGKTTTPAVQVVDEGYLDMGPIGGAATAKHLLSSVAAAASTLPSLSLSGVPHHHHHHPHHRSSVVEVPFSSLSNTVVSGGPTVARRRHSRHRSYQDNEPPEPPRESLEKLAQQFPLVPVKSFFSPTEESADLIKPVRAYSIGSRPKPSSDGLSPLVQRPVGSGWSGSSSQESFAGNTSTTGSSATALTAIGSTATAGDVVKGNDGQAGGTHAVPRIRAHSTGSNFNPKSSSIQSDLSMKQGSAAFGHQKQSLVRHQEHQLRKRSVTQESIVNSVVTSIAASTPSSNIILERSHETVAGDLPVSLNDDNHKASAKEEEEEVKKTSQTTTKQAADDEG